MFEGVYSWRAEINISLWGKGLVKYPKVFVKLDLLFNPQCLINIQDITKWLNPSYKSMNEFNVEFKALGS